MNKSSRVLLFIPMYNCEKQIIRVLRQIDGETKSIFDGILIVNNRSTDNSEELVRQYIHKQENDASKFILVRNTENYGLGGSHKVAFSYAVNNGFDFVIVLHGDDQGNVTDILPFLKSGEYINHDCLLGARFQKGSLLKGYSLFRTFGNRVYNILFSLVSGKKIYDLGSGLNGYKTSILKDDFFVSFPDNLTFNYCMILASMHYKHKVKFFPISWREDDQISNVKLFSQAFKVLRFLLAYAINKQKFLHAEHREKIVKKYSAEIIK